MPDATYPEKYQFELLDEIRENLDTLDGLTLDESITVIQLTASATLCLFSIEAGLTDEQIRKAHAELCARIMEGGPRQLSAAHKFVEAANAPRAEEMH